MPPWAALSAVLFAGGILPGCNGKAAPPAADAPQLKEAVEQLQRGQPQKALDLLGENHSARGRWLKSIALERLDRLDDAKAQIDAALTLEPDRAEFQGLRKRFELYGSRIEAADEILKLHEADRTNAALALFAFYAHTAKAVHLNALKKPKEATAEGGRGVKALRSAVSLNAEIPEFQREMLSLAVKTQLADEADLLSEKLTRQAPGEPELVAERATVLAMLRQFDRAVDVAATLYELRQKDVGTARFYASVLTQSTPSADRERRLKSLANDHPQELSLLVQYGVYLVRSGRLGDAVREFEGAIRNQPDKQRKQATTDALISLTLEASDAKQAAESLEKHRATVSDPLLVAYFEGRVRILQGDFAGALERFSAVVQGEKDAPGSHRQLAGEAIFWTEAILNDKEASRRLGEAADAIRERAGLPPLNASEPAVAEIPESGESQTAPR